VSVAGATGRGPPGSGRDGGGARRPRLGQHFLADPNLLDAIVRDSGVGPDDVVLEVGGGAGALTERLAPAVGYLHVVELDERLREPLEAVAARAGNVSVLWGDAMRVDLGGLEPSPSAMVSNLPYSIATPLLVRTVEELPSLATWTVMVQREVADRLRAGPGSRLYGAPSAVLALACEMELIRTVDRAVFTPRPRVDSALLRLRRRAPAASPAVRDLIRAAFAHRRKSLPRSLELAAAAAGAEPAPRELRERARAALVEAGHRPDARAESLAPGELAELARRLGAT
jgi:16S rRNA (adenine1518-N6/adenine1519-N6)-dimethyltransferase